MLWMCSDCRIIGSPRTSILYFSISVHVFAETVARAAAYIGALQHGIRGHEALGVCFTREPLSEAALMANSSGFHALNTIKTQSIVQKNVRETPEAPTEISLGGTAAVRAI